MKNKINPILIVLIGPCGCGKSTLAKELEKENFIRISQDDQGRRGHLEQFNQALENRYNIIVDRMNFNCEQRMRYVRPAVEKGYEIQYILFKTPKEICLERLKTRKNHPTIKTNMSHNAILDFYFKNFEFPCEDEFDWMEIKF